MADSEKSPAEHSLQDTSAVSKPRQRRATGRSAAEERKTYLLKLYALLSLIMLLLIALLIITGEDGIRGEERTSTGEVEEAPAVVDAPSDRGSPEPGFQEPSPELTRPGPEATSPEDLPRPDSGLDVGSDGQSDLESDEPADRDPQEGPTSTDPIPPPVGDLYMVLDDAGYSMTELQPFLELGIPLTVSVLPHLQYSADAARATVRSGNDVMLHMPMEPRGAGNPGTGAIRVSHEPQEIVSRLQNALDSVPFAVAVNNHMGSAVTEHLLLMQVVVEDLHERGLFFLDSRTTADTTVAQAGGNIGIPTVERHVFIDHYRDVDSMRDALRTGIERARFEGYAVLIGHVQTRELPELLTWAAREAASVGVVFRPISHMGVRYAGLLP